MGMAKLLKDIPLPNDPHIRPTYALLAGPVRHRTRLPISDLRKAS